MHAVHTGARFAPIDFYDETQWRLCRCLSFQSSVSELILTRFSTARVLRVQLAE